MIAIDDDAEGEPRSSNKNKAGDSGDVGLYENSEGLVYTTLEFDTSGDPDLSQPRSEDGNSRRVKILQDTTEYTIIQIYLWFTGGYDRLRNHPDLAIRKVSLDFSSKNLKKRNSRTVMNYFMLWDGALD